eukprot:356183-Chlamydomonas_euryale.AAC.5
MMMASRQKVTDFASVNSTATVTVPATPGTIFRRRRSRPRLAEGRRPGYTVGVGVAGVLWFSLVRVSWCSVGGTSGCGAAKNCEWECATTQMRYAFLHAADNGRSAVVRCVP